MTMLWDAPLTAGLARELDQRLRDQRLLGHRFGWKDRELSLFFDGGTLSCSLHPRKGWIGLLPATALPDEGRPLSARCVGVTAPPDERVLRIRFSRLRGRVRSVQFILELMTNQWNALLVEGEDETIRHVLWSRHLAERTLAVGHRYRPPEPSTRAGIEAPLSREAWERLVTGLGEAGGAGHLLARLAFTSPLNLPSLLGQGEEGPIPASRVDEGYRLWRRLRSLDPMEPCLLETTGGEQPYPIPLPHLASRDMPSILEALQAASEGGWAAAGPRRAILERLERAIQRTERRVASLRREMDSAADPEEPRRRAHLLLAHLGKVEKGTSEVTLPGFEGGEVTLALDPTLSPHQNAEALYREAARLERARERLPALLRGAEERGGVLRAMRTRILDGSMAPEEAARSLPELPETRPGGDEAKEPDRWPYRRFRSTGGLEIRVGRGSADNDALTFRHSAPNDIWLHAREASGAHVILRWAREDPPPKRDLTEAAVLAALYSRARGAGVVPVDWTRRKHVRKPRKAGPGTVLPERVQTLFVEPDADLPGRLAWEG